MKTLAIILNHNLPEYTNWLYQSLWPYREDIYDLLVMDNGSLPEYLPERVDIRFETNLFFGGALNEAFRMVLSDSQYDSLLFLNNDLEVTPEIFVRLLRNELLGNDFALVSPCVAGRPQPWRQMQNWGAKEIREVKWIDLQAPLFHRKIIESIGQFDKALYYGWGQELVCFDKCMEMGWKTGVCDFVSILHVGKQTLLQNRLFEKDNENGSEVKVPISLADSHASAMAEYRQYFMDHPLKHGDFEDLRNYGETYVFESSLCGIALRREPGGARSGNGMAGIHGMLRRWLRISQ